MSYKYKGKNANTGPGSERMLPGLEMITEGRIRDAIDSGKTKNALDLAKDFHKAHPSAESEALLLDAYVARIQGLIQQNLAFEANSLIDLARQRFPSSAERLDDLKLRTAAHAGDLRPIVALLNDPNLTTERRAVLERIIQQDVGQLAHITACEGLSAEHPLHKAASSLERALKEVTAGPVSDEVLALPEVSHRSPLAPWKVLIRAIGAFYRNDLNSCRQAIDAIKPESAAARLVPALKALTGGKPDGVLSGCSTELVTAVSAGAAAVETSLENLESAFQSKDISRLRKAIKNAIQIVSKHDGSILDVLRLRILGRAILYGVDFDDLDPSSFLQERRGPALLQISARAMEMVGIPATISTASGIWNEFRLAAIAEGWFKNDGPEVAILYLHQAGILAALNPGELKSIHKMVAKDQKEEQFFLFPEKLFKRACAIDPHTEAFSQWLTWTKRVSDQKAVKVAEAWNKACPHDIEPLLFLMADAEARESDKSLQYLSKAERVDAVNPAVRRARIRIMLQSSRRQIQKGKYALAEETLTAISALPQSQQGDRQVAITALRFVAKAAGGNHEKAGETRLELDRLMGGSIAADITLHCFAAACDRAYVVRLAQPAKFDESSRMALPAAVAKVAAITKEYDFRFDLPRAWVVATEKQFPKQRKTLDVPQLLSLGRAALASTALKFAYAVSAEGLSRGGPSEATFLLLRADSLPHDRYERRGVCAAAAATLARDQHDNELFDRAQRTVAEDFKTAGLTLDIDKARYVVAREKEATRYPALNSRTPSYRDLLPNDCPCPECRRARGESVGPFVDPFSDIDVDDDDDVDFDMGFSPEDMLDVFLGEAKRAMDRGESLDQFFKRVGFPNPGSGGRGGRGKRK